jgi:hypothetical protein
MALLNNQSSMAKAYLPDWPGRHFVCITTITLTSEYAPVWWAVPVLNCELRSMS